MYCGLCVCVLLLGEGVGVASNRGFSLLRMRRAFSLCDVACQPCLAVGSIMSPSCAVGTLVGVVALVPLLVLFHPLSGR